MKTIKLLITFLLLLVIGCGNSYSQRNVQNDEEEEQQIEVFGEPYYYLVDQIVLYRNGETLTSATNKYFTIDKDLKYVIAPYSDFETPLFMNLMPIFYKDEENATVYHGYVGDEPFQGLTHFELKVFNKPSLGKTVFTVINDDFTLKFILIDID